MAANFIKNGILVNLCIGELCESLPYLGTGVYLARIYLG